MKKLVRIIIITIAALLIGSLWYLSFSKISKKNAANERFETIPSIELLTSQNEKILLTDFSFDEIKVLIYFNTHCDFCQFELAELYKRLPQFENCEIILVSAEPIDSLINLEQSLGLSAFPNIGVYHCSYDSLLKHFGQLGAPTIFIYGTENKLLKRFNGSTRIDDLLEVIDHAENKLAAYNKSTP